ncbi:MAG TPA: FAD-dependent oxidoreductase, partial [Solirubrobacteraceae bacterium]|nr:FAD-dependent oxidoreductase [Solirubrobacteraceae bacterium]
MTLPASRTTRRGFLLAGAGALAGAALGARPVGALAAIGAAPGPELPATGARPDPAQPSIAIVGAGLAGLRCAHMLWTRTGARPLASTVYEANPERAGGRCWTLRGFFDAGLITEHGGQLIDSTHYAVRALARRLGLREEVVGGGDLPSGEEAFWIDGAHYSQREADADWEAVGFRAFHQALLETRTPAGLARLDSLSVPEWLEGTAIGASSRLGKLLLANAVTENGGDPSDMSALGALIEITDKSGQQELALLPGDNEKFHVAGGNDQLVAGMLAELPPEAVQHDRRLVALRASSDGTSTLSFDTPAGTLDVRADVVVLALPFSTLRQADLSKSGLSAAKLEVVEQLGMGTNAKLHVELSHKTWPALGFAGAAYGEWDRFCCGWDDSVPLGPEASPALFVGFPGAEVGAAGLTGAAHGEAPAADVDWLLGEIEPVYPGTSAAYTGRAYEDHWALDPYVMG